MKNRKLSLLPIAFVLALIVDGCTYELPTAEVLVDGPGGSGGTGGTGGVTVSSSSSSMIPAEDCLDGIDNDEDGAVDCADSDCSDGFTCTDVLPDGWTRVFVERGNGEPPAEGACANGEKPEILFTGPAGPAKCDACECGTLEGTICRPRVLNCFLNSATCGTSATNMTNTVGGADCTKPDLGGAISVSCRVPGQAQVDQAGSCTPSIADFPNKYPWTGWVRSCLDTTPEGGGCVGGTCIPKPASGSSTCIRKDGSEVCPAGWAGTETYASAKDDRACSECTCTPKPQCTGGGYEFFDYNNCDSNGAVMSIMDATCRDMTNYPDLDSWSVKRFLPEASGSCLVGGGAPVGSVVPEKPVTFCCK